MSDTVLEFDGVWKKFKRGECYDSLRDLVPAIFKKTFSGRTQEELKEKEFWALKDISFQVKRGEALGIIGPNGSGKSTALKILSGILRSTKGVMKVKGRMSALIEVGAGFHPDLTGRENVYLNGTILGMKRAEIDGKLDEIIDFSGISEFIDTPVKRYSSGMYARLGFSIAAHVDPELLLVDEVLSVGDMWFQEKCIKKMLDFKDKETAIIFVSHNLESVNLLCPNTAFLKKGELLRIGPTPEIIRDYIDSNMDATIPQSGSDSIWGVNLQDEAGDICNAIKPQQKLNLRFKYKCEKDLNECQLGFIVTRIADGLMICDYNLSMKDSSKIDKNENEAIIYFNANLLRGTYAISLHIYHYPSARHIVYLKNLLFFSVEERFSYDGIAHLEPLLVLN